MKFLDLFAGIGGFRLGMERAGHECIGFCEIDKFARASYKAIHDTTGEIELHDITTVSDDFIRSIGNVDVICGGFPCQAFSIAGKRQGFEDTRGTLFFQIARFASILKPRYLFLENVKGLLHHDGGQRSEQSSKRWKNWGTTSSGKCLTANISEYRKTANECSLSDILEEQVDEKYFLSGTVTKKLISYQAKEIQPIHSSQGTPLVNQDRLLLKINKRA